MTGFINYFIQNISPILGLFVEHVQLTVLAIIISIVVGIPLGIPLLILNHLKSQLWL